MKTYRDFFRRARGDADAAPFPYQERLATGDWPTLLDVPTGLGKTAAVMLAWAYKRSIGDASTPRRLVYCLPMRSLVEQTAAEAKKFTSNLGLSEKIEVHSILGGVEPEKLRAFLDRPETDAILIGTQDMLLSRALNRGYAMSRYQWPIAFGLLHGDAMWVFDETQLMGVGVETSAQLEGLRRSLGTALPCRSLWMSATLGRSQLATVDHPSPVGGFASVGLGDDDRAIETVRLRIESRKKLERSDLVTPKKASELADYAKRVAALAKASHVDGARTIVIVNRVARAQAIYAALLAAGVGPERAVLVHSRFRPAERRRAEAAMKAAEDGFVVATQAIEAGVDVSSARMITELAPWASLVQRFGRLNRYGEQADARCVVLDADTTAPDACRPYEASDLAIAREHLAKLSDVGPASLGAIVHEEPRIVRPILRRRDLLDLFDTSPELLGSDLDVGRFVRDGEDLDVSVFYRAFDGAPSSKMPAPSRDELCSISLATARSLLERLAKEAKDRSDPELAAFVWNPLEEAFQKVRRVSPGQVLLLPVRAGGYDAMLGFTGEPKHVPEPVTSSGAELEANDADPLTSIGTWVTLTDHLGHVADAAEQLADQVSLSAAHAEAIVRAARFHDVGKAHPAFQAMLGGPDGEGSGSGPWAKSDGRRGRTVRRGFRHEWASALLLLQTESLPDTDLVAYLVAAHHGKVRLSVRALPEETAPDDDRIFARGVWDGDELPAIAMPDGTTLPASRLDASPVRLGRGSWLERTTRLRDDPSLGPFVLAYLEALVRIADARASRAEREGAGSDDPSMEMP